jgi:hypothetical protein
MASKEVADLTHLEDWTGVEIHIVRGVVRDGGGNVTNHGHSRRVPFAELAARLYQYGSFATTAIGASEILMDHVVAVAHTLPVNFAGSVAKVGTNPAALWTADVQKNGVSIGSLAISAAGVVTFTTSGGAVAMAVGDVLTLVAPVAPDASIARLRFTFKGN